MEGGDLRRSRTLDGTSEDRRRTRIVKLIDDRR